VKGLIGHDPFESGTCDAEESIKLMAGLKDLLEIVPGLVNDGCDAFLERIKNE
jgi:hypothetical protein